MMPDRKCPLKHSSRGMQLLMLRQLYKPSHTIADTGDKGFGKTHNMVTKAYILWSMGYSIATNLVFKRRRKDGKFEKAYPERVHPVPTFLDIVRITIKLMNSPTRDKRVLVLLDEIQNFMSAMHWSDGMVVDLATYLSLTRKFHQIWEFGTPTYEQIPAAIRIWTRNVMTYHFWKKERDVRDFNRRAHTNLTVKQMAGVEKPGTRAQPHTIGICPWTKPERLAKPGEFVYDHMSSGSSLTMGGWEGLMWNPRTKQNERVLMPFSFKKLVEICEFQISEDMPQLVTNYIEEMDRGEWQVIGPGPSETREEQKPLPPPPPKAYEDYTTEDKRELAKNMMRHLAVEHPELTTEQIRALATVEGRPVVKARRAREITSEGRGNNSIPEQIA